MNELNKQIIDVLANSTEKLNHKQIAAKMKIFDKKGRAEVMKELGKLVNAKVVLKAGRGKYKLNSKFQDTKTTGKHYIVGRVEQKRSGMAFVIPQGKQDDTAEESTIDDIFVADGNLGNALNGDLVKVVLFPARKGKRLEGQVVEVVQRSKRQLVGTIHIKQGIAFFVPDNTILRRDVIIPGKQLRKAKTGDKVVVHILDWASGHRNPIGEVLNVLGKPGSNEVEMLSILAESDFPVTFPKAVEQEAEAIPTEIPEKEILRRRDFRDVTTFTIDPADAKDFDDALSFEVLESGLYRVGIHIADVSYYVKPGSGIDQEAYNRGTSVYLVDRTIPMLPEALSNNLCSLRPDEDKLCYSAVFDLDDKAKVHKEWFGHTIIRSNRRFDYEQAQQIISKSLRRAKATSARPSCNCTNSHR